MNRVEFMMGKIQIETCLVAMPRFPDSLLQEVSFKQLSPYLSGVSQPTPSGSEQWYTWLIISSLSDYR